MRDLRSDCRGAEIRARVHPGPCGDVSDAPRDGRAGGQEALWVLRHPRHGERQHGGEAGGSGHAARRGLPDAGTVQHAIVRGRVCCCVGVGVVLWVGGFVCVCVCVSWGVCLCVCVCVPANSLRVPLFFTDDVYAKLLVFSVMPVTLIWGRLHRSGDAKRPWSL